MRRFFTSNLGFKVVSLLSAVVVWFFVNAELSDERSLRIAVKVIPPEGRIVSPDEVFVTLAVQGPRGRLGKLSAGQIVSEYEMPVSQPDGVYVARFTRDNFRLPAGEGLKVARVEPEEIDVLITQKFSKQFRARVVYEGEPARGMEVVGYEAFPASVTVTGPKDALDAAEFIETDPVDISGASGTVSVVVGLEDYVIGPAGMSRVYCEEKVSAKVLIRPKPAERMIENVPVMVLSQPAGTGAVKVLPTSVAVRVRGPGEVVAPLTAADILVFVDIAQSPKGGEALTLGCRLPGGVSLAEGYVLPKVRVLIVSQ